MGKLTGGDLRFGTGGLFPGNGTVQVNEGLAPQFLSRMLQASSSFRAVRWKT